MLRLHEGYLPIQDTTDQDGGWLGLMLGGRV